MGFWGGIWGMGGEIGVFGGDLGVLGGDLGSGGEVGGVYRGIRAVGWSY